MALLLSPAGSPEALRAAIDAGADEVYLGGTQFNARAGARNFTDAQLIEAGKQCRDAGVRLLITLNTLVADREMDAVLRYVAFLQRQVMPHAYIVQDLGLAKRLKEQFPEVVLHASTQLRQHSSGGADLLKRLGFTRIVLARELSRTDIASFIRATGMDCEVFVHGALCVCESGGCLMSSMIGRRSGNRGECAQPCRLPYRGTHPYPLSLKDQCLAPYLTELAAMGVTALKIEGRMKAPDYVYAVTACYRKLLDEKRLPTQQELKQLQSAFSRSGFTAGYYEGNVSPDMFGVRSQADKQKTQQFRPQKQQSTPYVRSNLPEPALPLQLPQKNPACLFPPNKQLGYVARFEGNLPRSWDWLHDAARIDIPLWRLSRADIRGREDRISVILPRVVFDCEEDDIRRLLRQAQACGIRHATVPNLSLLPLLSNCVPDFYLHGDYPLNVYNRETLQLLEGYSFSSLFLSPETDPHSFGFSACALETLGYGRLPLMHTETCLIRNIRGHCLQEAICHAELTDRTGACFPVLRGYRHRNLLYNALPTYRLDHRKDLKKHGVGLLTLLFTVENEAIMKQMVERYRSSASPEGMLYTRR